MAIASHINEMMASSSFIRKMFETGNKMKAMYGQENVFDFSLGNPSAAPPEGFSKALMKVVQEDFSGKHKYMPNAGYPDVREKLSENISKELNVKIGADRLLMTCGAGGAMNVVLKSLVNPGDKVLVNAPCFMEYNFYVSNHGGKLEIISPTDNFDLNFEAMEKAIDKNTAAVIINSPNNPTGFIYSSESLKKLADLLDKKKKETGRTIYIISDEPYRKIVFDGLEVPSVFEYYSHSLVATSYSKDLSIPGERIGWLAIHPDAEDALNLFNACVLCNRILGYVNAPAIMQKAVMMSLGTSVDISEYSRNRDVLCSALTEIGYELIIPKGTFYAFPKAPGGDDLAVIDALQKQKILCVPGRGFAAPGYFRIAFCVDENTVRRSIDGFRLAFNEITRS